VCVTKLSPGGDHLEYSTFIGGSDWDQPGSIAVDASGAAVITGGTSSPDFPTTPGAFDTDFSYSGSSDAFVTKLSPDGASLMFSTFLGSHSSAYAIGLDPSGAATVAGIAVSDFPTTPGAYDTTLDGLSDGFVTRLSPSGDRLLYSTLLGGQGRDEADVIAVHASGTVFVAGLTSSDDFPATPGAFDTSYNGGGMFSGDTFVARFDLGCPRTASLLHYGSGWAGTSGVPLLTARVEPVPCAKVAVSLDNSLGAQTPALLIVGDSAARLVTAFEGTLLVTPLVAFLIDLPAGGISLLGTIPCDGLACGTVLFVQACEIDPGASKGVSFTPGLQLVIGG